MAIVSDQHLAPAVSSLCEKHPILSNGPRLMTSQITRLPGLGTRKPG